MPQEAKRQNKIKLKLSALANLAKKRITRQASANLMMVSFIMLTTIGCFLIYTPAGFISAGLACGLFGFLLGQE